MFVSSVCLVDIQFSCQASCSLTELSVMVGGTTVDHSVDDCLSILSFPS